MTSVFHFGEMNDKDISVDTDTNGDKSVRDIDEVAKESKEETKGNIIFKRCTNDAKSNDGNTVQDAENAVHQHQPVQSTFHFILDHMNKVSIKYVDQE